MCNCRYVGSQAVGATTPANDAEDEMTQCLRWVTDAYNEFLVHGKLSEERVNRLQMVYDKLASENMAHDSGVQTMSNLSTMMGTSNPTGMQIPSLMSSRIPPPVSASAIPTIMGVGKPISPISRQNQRSRSRSVEKPLLPTPDVADGRHPAQTKSHAAQSLESPVNCGLADGESMEMGSEDGGAPYSPFDSPYDLFDAKSSSAAPRDGAPSESRVDSIHMPAAVTKDRTPSGIPSTSSPFSSAASDRGHVKPQSVQPPPVLTPQDILAARIVDELALVEVLVRIQFELASIGDLPAEDAAEAGIAVSGGPSTPPARPQSPPTTADAADPKSLVKDSLPALPSPSSLQAMIGESATPPSTTQQSTAVSETLSQSTVSRSGSGKVPPPAAIISGKLPYTPPTEPDVVHSLATAAPVYVNSSKTSTSTVTKPLSSSSSQQVKSSKPTTTSASSQQSKTSSAAAKSGTVDKSASADGNEKVLIDLLVTLYLVGIARGDYGSLESPVHGYFFKLQMQ